MLHKFCENHLGQLYEAIKTGNIADIEKIEHELSPIEECVACAYALKARGEAREVLIEYLKSQGITVEFGAKSGILESLWFWSTRLLLFLVIFLPVFLVFQNLTSAILSLIFALTFSIFFLVFLEQFLERD